MREASRCYFIKRRKNLAAVTSGAWCYADKMCMQQQHSAVPLMCAPTMHSKTKANIQTVTSDALHFFCFEDQLVFQQFPKPRINQHTHLKTKHCNTIGLFRELNPGPLAPEARIIPLDQTARCPKPQHFLCCKIMLPPAMKPYLIKPQAKVKLRGISKPASRHPTEQKSDQTIPDQSSPDHTRASQTRQTNAA